MALMLVFMAWRQSCRLKQQGQQLKPHQLLASLNKSFSLFLSEFSVVTEPSPGPTSLLGVKELIAEGRSLQQSGHNDCVFYNLPIDFISTLPVKSIQLNGELVWSSHLGSLRCHFLWVPFISCFKTTLIKQQALLCKHATPLENEVLSLQIARISIVDIKKQFNFNQGHGCLI